MDDIMTSKSFMAFIIINNWHLANQYISFDIYSWETSSHDPVSYGKAFTKKWNVLDKIKNKEQQNISRIWSIDIT